MEPTNGLTGPGCGAIDCRDETAAPAARGGRGGEGVAEDGGEF